MKCHTIPLDEYKGDVKSKTGNTERTCTETNLEKIENGDVNRSVVYPGAHHFRSVVPPTAKERIPRGKSVNYGHKLSVADRENHRESPKTMNHINMAHPRYLMTCLRSLYRALGSCGGLTGPRLSSQHTKAVETALLYQFLYARRVVSLFPVEALGSDRPVEVASQGAAPRLTRDSTDGADRPLYSCPWIILVRVLGATVTCSSKRRSWMNTSFHVSIASLRLE